MPNIRMDYKDTESIFKPLAADDTESEPIEVESLCMNCGENGITKILPTKIPFYKEVVLISFDCELCGYQNNEIQSGSRIEDKGIRLVLKVCTDEDLNRQVVKSDYTSIKIPELEFEIPSQSQKGEITTVEGIINHSIHGLEQDQDRRREENPETAVKIEAFIEKLKELKEIKSQFTMILEDISGNCFITNPKAPQKDCGLETTTFIRSKEQNHALGIYTQDEIDDCDNSTEEKGVLKPGQEEDNILEDLEKEVLCFRTFCPDCGASCHTNMKMTDIPYFKQVVIMATSCEACGHRSNEVKSGGGIESHGIRIEVTVSDTPDLTRDVLKSETCSLFIPELDLEVGPAALGGRFSTVEGIITAMRDQLADKNSMFSDSIDPESKLRLDAFLKEIDVVLSGKKPVTLVLVDPAGNSYVQSLTAPDPDPGLKITRYERSFDDNEELGLNDMKVENYEES